MARLGELLVAAGVLTAEQIDRALRAQVMWGARLGTNLVELGLIDLEVLSIHLGNQHGLPPSLARHFEKADHALQLLLSPSIAEKLCCLPLLRAGPRRELVVVAAATPLSKPALAMIADELVVEPGQLIVSIAAELRIRYQLERIYDLARPARFMRAPGEHATPFPMFEALPDFEDSAVDNELQQPASPAPEYELEFSLDPPSQPIAAPRALADLDDLPADVDDAAPRAVEQEPSSGRTLRHYVRTIADPEPEKASLARIAIRRVAVTAAVGIAEPSGETKTLNEATRSIRRATDRDRVAELSMETLARFTPTCHAAALMVLRGQIATSWKAFSRSGAPLPELSVPLDPLGLVQRVAQRNQTARGPSSELGTIDQLLMSSLGHDGGELIVVPVSIGGDVMCVIAMVTEIEAPATTAESIAAAVGAAFARLMRNASR